MLLMFLPGRMSMQMLLRMGLPHWSQCRARRHVDLQSHHVYLPMNEANKIEMTLTHIIGSSGKMPLDKEHKVQESLKHNSGFSYLHFIFIYILKLPWKTEDIE